MKKFYHLAICAIVAITMNSCFFGGSTTTEEPKFQLGDLQGRWVEVGTQHFVNFTTERSDEYPYYLGYEWDEAEEVFESDLLTARQELGHPGNGWFKYDFKTTDGNLTEIHLMDNEGAEIPKIYVVSKLTETALEYYEKDRPSSKFSFEKMVYLPD